MAKGIGLIGNFRGKVGNMVGYNLKDSNNKQTQGVRVYQPIVKNPKTYAQAEQRAKLAPINATYRVLKMIIDRGQEGKAYGNKSRLAWLSDAMKSFNGCWFEKGANIVAPALVPVSKGSLSPAKSIIVRDSIVQFLISDTALAPVTTMGALSAAVLAYYPELSVGDQITFVGAGEKQDNLYGVVKSIVLTESTSEDALPSGISVTDYNSKGYLTFTSANSTDCGTVIFSKEGNNGSHLRSSATLKAVDEAYDDYLSDEAKENAIRSYMASGTNVDWAEESLQG